MKKLYRPVGLYEAKNILDSGLTSFPPRRYGQPIFYPVLNLEYARQIASEWNAPDPGSNYAGFVTEFYIDEQYISKYQEKIVGTPTHRELWVPAEELEEFNRNIKGKIQFVDAFYGEKYFGMVLVDSHPENCSADAQFNKLLCLMKNNRAGLADEIKEQWQAVLLNFNYWILRDYSVASIIAEEKQELLGEVVKIWGECFGDIKLPGSGIEQ